MNSSTLQELISELRVELDALDIDDQNSRQRIEGLITELEDQVDAGPGSTSLSGSMPSYIEQFEVEHPRLTQVLNRIAVSLSEMGI